jgi:hypothetical protein
MFRVVASNTYNGGALELVPKFPILRRNRSTSSQQLQPATANIKDVASFDNNISHDQRVYRVHFSIVDKNRSWMRGTKRSIRW